MNWFDRICIGGIVVSFAVFSYHGIIKPVQEAYHFQKSYHAALSRFADKNHDGDISFFERLEFSNRLFPDFTVNGLGEIPRYPDGRVVPYEVLESRISDYEKKHPNI